ncbi:D-3-phosphoglycerate dehydrogenase family [Micractinium conductrix]|uniref:D-3-phosphoglycerate dehydrogenase n=1 Tax=Micractinium conductrix TaxID=554055 RepID=A0A2P6VL31_9CHLO|nr:D-3-phosphoglycerate dehydrogenase family [Micractinium conductrix]|eukprot:PSC74816.1 D-3-phosphoglycerate dehydrogenase family [Micractinium conductrix]
MQCSAAASLTTPVARQAAPRMQQRLAGAGGALQVAGVRVAHRRAGRAAALGRPASMSVVAVASEAAKPTILVAEKLGAGGVDMLKEVGTVDCSYDLSKEDLLAKISLVDAIVIRSATKVTREVFEASKGRLKVVGRAGVGIDNVDLAAASEVGCLVVNAPTANTVAAAEHGIALLCALARNVAQADSAMKAGRWERSKWVGVSMVGKTLAIMGFGKVGSEVARRARGLGMTVVAYDPYASAEKAAALGVTIVSFDEALSRGDFFSLHMPLTPNTKGMFNDEAFGKMKKGARIVNVARGGVIDDDSLVRALDSGVVAGAALDVFEIEPPAADNPLVGRPDVICTPHLGASTKEAQEEVAYEIAEAVISALNGELTPSCVNAPMMAPEVLKELQPYTQLADGLGRAAVQLVEGSGFDDVFITYHSPRGDDLDTRLLRAMVVKGILEQITTSQVNLVNADLLAKKRGLRITETVVPADGDSVLNEIEVSIGTNKARFSSAVDKSGRITVAGCVKSGAPFLTKIGTFDIDLGIEGEVVLVRQTDQPGIIAAVSSELATNKINISFMSVAREAKGTQAIMAIGVDEAPSAAVMRAITDITGIQEVAVFSEKRAA